MIGIAGSDINDRRILFTNTGDKKGLHPAIIEKDFWVCYVLDYPFHRSEWKNALVFKGGTSLSKTFHVIKRFSEDIDLILDWRLIKYGIDEPWEERSHNQQDKFNKQMIKNTAEYLQSVFVPAVTEGIRKEIGEDITDALGTDYEHMKNMFYGQAPEFEKVLQYLAALEEEINTLDNNQDKQY